MNKEEVEQVLEELYNVRPEMLNEKAKKLFDAIMSIANERDTYKQQNKQLNEMNEKNYNNYCEALKEIKAYREMYFDKLLIINKSVEYIESKITDEYDTNLVYYEIETLLEILRGTNE